jgi:hypothetical protein
MHYFGGEGSQPVEGAGVETEAALGAPSAPSAQPDHEVLYPGEGKAGGVVAVQPEGSKEGGAPVGDAAPALADLQNKLCPNCHTGVLYVIRYDPNALHEHGQDVGTGVSAAPMPRGFESGGGYDVLCMQCGWSQSYALNPGQHHGKAR